jgi:CheY-like chemotaxis protein/anti-sigma regulatory factor (Ser/Thr protein kinase)
MAKVLVVDDSPLDRRLAGSILEAEGAIVVYAEHGRDALEKIPVDKPDIVLTDLQMPEMDGLTLVGEIRRSYPSTPVILMTGQGSEEIAVAALRGGAASYVPKRNLNRDLTAALSIVLDAAESDRERKQVMGLLRQSESYYVLGYEPVATRALVNHLLDGLSQMDICGESDRLRVGTALGEALVNAIDHGNLELESSLRQENGSKYRLLGNDRAVQPPYRDRRVHVKATMTSEEATFVIRDEGPGFDPHGLPDPTDPENLTKPSGRGVMLIRTFMDNVGFNADGNEITMIKRRRSEGVQA